MPDNRIALEILGDLLQDALKESRRSELALKDIEVKYLVQEKAIEGLQEDLKRLRKDLQPVIAMADRRQYSYKIWKLWQNSVIRITTIIVGGATGLAALVGAIAGLLKIVLPHLQTWFQ